MYRVISIRNIFYHSCHTAIHELRYLVKVVAIYDYGCRGIGTCYMVRARNSTNRVEVASGFSHCFVYLSDELRTVDQ